MTISWIARCQNVLAFETTMGEAWDVRAVWVGWPASKGTWPACTMLITCNAD